MCWLHLRLAWKRDDVRVAFVPHASYTDHGLVEVLLLVDAFGGIEHGLGGALAFGLGNGARVPINGLSGWC